MADADTFFGQELPAVMAVVARPRCGRAHRRSPRWSSAASDSEPSIRERQDLLLEWLPNAEPFVLPGATHLLQIQQPRALAGALAGFFARHQTQGGPTPNWDPRPPSG